jgi:hypothetical protein
LWAELDLMTPSAQLDSTPNLPPLPFELGHSALELDPGSTFALLDSLPTPLS